MPDATCIQCGTNMTGRVDKVYCSKQCAEQAQPPCATVGCGRPRRARGLCPTHYNQAHQPERHAKVAVSCDYCGAMCEKEPTSKYGTRYCSLACRDAAWRPGRTACKVYFTECLVCEQLFTTRSTTAVCCSTECLDTAQRLTTPVRPTRPSRPEPKTNEPHEFLCAWCGTSVESIYRMHTYCSRRCTRKAAKVRRRAREHAVFGSYTWTDFMRIAARFDYRCAYCNIKPDSQLDPDHVVPLSRGGSNTAANLLPACRDCNSSKCDALLDEWSVQRHKRGQAPRATTWAPEDKRYHHLTSVTAANPIAA